MQTLFEPLRRGGTESSETLPERTNLGLGLFIVQEIARSHGGSIAARSNEGQTVFTMSLPVVPIEG